MVDPFDEHRDVTFDRSPVGQVVTTVDGWLLAVNKTFLDWIGVGRSWHTGGADRRIQDLLTVGARMYYETHLLPLLQMQRHASEIALEFKAADGRRMPALVNAVLDDDDPRLVRWAVFPAKARRSYEREVLAAKELAEASERNARLLAKTLQQTLVPAVPPRISGLDIAAAYRPAGDGTEIGGDFYDVFQITRDDWMVALGDVQGKGIEAALVTALARYSIRGAAVEQDSPADVLRVLNTVLRLDSTERLCTAIVMKFHRSSGGWHVRLSAGGHPLPFLRTGDGRVVEIGAPGSLLGFFEHPELSESSVELAPDELLLAFTDGVNEARSGREWYGEQRIAELMADRRRGGAGEMVEALLADVLRFENGVIRDDIAIVGVQAVSESEHP